MVNERETRQAWVSVHDLHTLCVEAFCQVGVRDADARTAADGLVTTDTWGVFSHGVKALRGYVRRLRGGGLRAEGRPAVVGEGPAWALADGHVVGYNIPQLTQSHIAV
jgi:LDH2 family malate/lactate/ureidoglycolate dehydrogenase